MSDSRCGSKRGRFCVCVGVVALIATGWGVGGSGSRAAHAYHTPGATNAHFQLWPNGFSNQRPRPAVARGSYILPQRDSG